MHDPCHRWEDFCLTDSGPAFSGLLIDNLGKFCIGLRGQLWGDNVYVSFWLPIGSCTCSPGDQECLHIKLIIMNTMDTPPHPQWRDMPYCGSLLFSGELEPSINGELVAEALQKMDLERLSLSQKPASIAAAWGHIMSWCAHGMDHCHAHIGASVPASLVRVAATRLCMLLLTILHIVISELVHPCLNTRHHLWARHHNGLQLVGYHDSVMLACHTLACFLFQSKIACINRRCTKKTENYGLYVFKGFMFDVSDLCACGRGRHSIAPMGACAE